ncbi:hypothetical protein OB955_18505 [Halobacteria archaeon AArc-m2/3/4]|uniref:Domain of unknown function domain-containing protein n=1 Tax=Natronoglomus mannanivorans TaxID=2979990 RepID=A0ABT2QIG4_9EURY|nr:hypothetical protein [Halobacteria archaeon AArc-m2/3/4]
MNTDTDRERGILSPADREYLLDEREMSHEQSKRNAEARIRRRITDGIVDFGLFVHYLERTDRQQVFAQATTDEAFVDGLTAMVAFAYIGLKEHGIDFERVLVPAVRSAEEAYAVEQSSTNVTVDVHFDVETTVNTTLEGIDGRITAGELVTPRELFSLVIEGGRDVANHDRIRLRLADDGSDRNHVERLAAYLEAEVRYPTASRAVLEIDDD